MEKQRKCLVCGKPIRRSRKTRNRVTCSRKCARYYARHFKDINNELHRTERILVGARIKFLREIRLTANAQAASQKLSFHNDNTKPKDL